jgi:hypothetical protein
LYVHLNSTVTLTAAPNTGFTLSLSILLEFIVLGAYGLGPLCKKKFV